MAAGPITTRASGPGRWRTMAGLGFRMMLHDRLKLAGTLFGVVFAVVLGNFQAGTFLALLDKNQMFVANAGADVWIAPPGTRQFQQGRPLGDAVLNRARATAGVAWAEPLVLGTAQVQLPRGGTEAVSLVGTRGPRFAGGPWNVVAGEPSALAFPGAVFFDHAVRRQLGGVNLGSVRELAGYRIQAVGFTWGLLPFGPAYAFAADGLARDVLRVPPDQHAFILVGAAPDEAPAALRDRLQAALPSTKVMTRGDFLREILVYILTGTQIGVSFGTSTFMGLLVGLITVALSMFSSVVENLRQFGTMKAIGARTGDLARLLLVQAAIYGVVGSLLGLGLTSALVHAIRNPDLTPILPAEGVAVTFAIMVLVCVAASLLALLRLRKLEPAMVFR